MERCLPYGGSKKVTKEWQANLKWPFGACLMKGFMKRNIIGGILRTAFNANNCELIMAIVT